jgi:hypothetical protein
MIMPLPTSLTGFLPHVMGALDTQLTSVETTEQGPSVRQKALAILTASVFAAVVSVIDAAAHTVLFAVYTPFVAIKEGIEAITGWQEFAPEALNTSDWIMHVKKVQSSVVIFLNAIVQGWTDPAGLLMIAKRHNLMPIIVATPGKVPEVAGV